jgi:RNA polymerase sigma factor (sigma-70 family)
MSCIIHGVNISAMQAKQKFRTTCWTMIERLCQGADPDSARALSDFCKSYHAPLLAYAAAFYPKDAEDLVQGFFERLIEQGTLAAADPQKGSLRTFLLTCFKRYIANHYRDLSAGKRGGKALHLPVDAAAGVADPEIGPEALYHRLWAKEVLEHAIARLREDWTTAGKAALFEELFPFLGFQGEEEEQQKTVAIRLGMTPGALKTAIYRIRREYREALLHEIGRTLKVRTEEEVLAELRNLMGWI